MKLLQTREFSKDLKRLDGSQKQSLKKLIQKISAKPRLGKPLKHFPNVFSERIGSKRLIYRFNENEILFVCFKSRDNVYEFIQQAF